MHFWEKLRKPFFALAPMADVTDPAYRRLIAQTAKPDVMWTEFVSADGLYHTREIKKMSDAENPLMRDLRYTEAERPVVAQIFSSSPERIAYASDLAARLGFDGVDINMGCPDKTIEKQCAGAALMKDPVRAKELVRAAKDGVARATPGGIPVSVKTRIGYDREALDTWLPALLETEPAAVTLHLRTRKEMSLVPAHWDLMPRAVEIRDSLGSKALIIGNGDVKSMQDAEEKVRAGGCDGAMLARAIFGNPWLFSERRPEDITSAEKLAALVLLARYFEELSPPKHFAILKKHFKAFVSGFDGAAELRMKLMEAQNAEQVAKIIREAGPFS